MTPWTTGLNILYGVGIAAIFGLSVFLHQEGVLSLAYLLGVLLFVFDLFGPLKALYGEATRLTVMNAALDRIEAVLDEPELPDNGNQHILSRHSRISQKYNLAMWASPIRTRKSCTTSASLCRRIP